MPQSPPTAANVALGQALGAMPATGLTIRQWLFGQALMGLCAIPNYHITPLCIDKALEATDGSLNALTYVPPPPVVTAPATTAATSTATAPTK